MIRLPNIIDILIIGFLLAGCADTSSTRSTVDEDTIVLGSVLSLTGKYSTNGIHTQNGYEIAVSRVNEMGGVMVDGKSYKLRVTYYDDESDPARSAQIAERMIRQDGVNFMLGPYTSGITRAVAAVTEKHKIPMVEAEGHSRALFSQGYRYLFGVTTVSHLYLASAVDLAAEIAERQGRNFSDFTVALAFEGDPFSQDVRAGVMETAKKYGMQIVIDDKLPRYLSDISATLKRVDEAKPDMLLLSAHSRGAETAARQIKELKVDVPIISITHCEAARIISKYGDSTNGFLCPTHWDDTLRHSGKYFGSAGDYAKLFKETFRGYQSVPYQAAGASAAVLVWKEAFERASSFDTDKVRDAIAATDMLTFYGGIKFGAEGYNVAKPMVIRQIQGGKLRVVAPTKWAPSPVDYPRQVPK